MTIPIQNIYYLLCYAWDRLEEGQLIDVERLPSTRLVDLFASVLRQGVSHILRRGLDRGYIEVAEAIAGVRGKLGITESLKRNVFSHARAHCVFDELSHDVTHNRIVKSTIRTLTRTEGLDHNLRGALADLLHRLPGIQEIALSSQVFRRVQLHRNNAYYGFLLDVCYLVHENLLVDERTGFYRFRDFLREEGAMRLLFQNFALNFFKREQSTYSVRSEQLRWEDARGSDEDLRFLPAMQTDIVLVSSNRRLIIDTKFSSETLQRRHKETVHSGHLYQLFSYLRNMQLKVGPGIQVDGMLLYPTVRQPVALHYSLERHAVSVRTINLDQEWRGIHSDMLRLVEAA